MNRIYGVEKDRPFDEKYRLAFVLAVSAGARSQRRSHCSRSVAASSTTERARSIWIVLVGPLGIALLAGGLAALFRWAPGADSPAGRGSSSEPASASSGGHSSPPYSLLSSTCRRHSARRTDRSPGWSRCSSGRSSRHLRSSMGRGCRPARSGAGGGARRAGSLEGRDDHRRACLGLRPGRERTDKPGAVGSAAREPTPAAFGGYPSRGEGSSLLRHCSQWPLWIPLSRREWMPPEAQGRARSRSRTPPRLRVDWCCHVELVRRLGGPIRGLVH